MSTPTLFLSLLLVAALAGCGPSNEQRAVPIAPEAAKLPAAGDDLTIYIGERFAETERQLLLTRVDLADATPRF
ncbi:MAG: hypothetical protein EOO22_12240 [Comamonadaceae bacterium]|nr:MAG: hypothetical protein EOO22_12240 [Comamonadaceae bacterium]